MTPERRAQIAGSERLVCLATDAFFANPHWSEDVDLAVELGKPILLLLHADTHLPVGFMMREMPAGSVIRVWRTRTELQRVAAEELGGNGPLNLIDGELPG